MGAFCGLGDGFKGLHERIRNAKYLNLKNYFGSDFEKLSKWKPSEITTTSADEGSKNTLLPPLIQTALDNPESPGAPVIEMEIGEDDYENEDEENENDDVVYDVTKMLENSSRSQSKN